jgi:predicted acyltransferase (DUF342 family)
LKTVWLVLFTQIKIHTYIKMVKNIPTIERSTKIRFGKHATDDQAENTIVFNASDTAINASTAGSMYMSPLREAELAGATFIGYSSITKEVVDTGVATSLLGGVTLDSAGVQGNVISNSIPHFANTLTAFTTGHGSNVGISNTAPTHMLSVGDKIFMSNTGAEAIKVEGNVRANRFFVGTAVTISGSATNKIQVSGKIKTGSLESTDSVAVSNNQTVTKLISVGTHTFIHNPSATESAITTSGNVSAAFYKGDAGLLSNVIHTGTLPISKGGTGQTTASAAASALGLGVGDQPSFVTVNANVNASNIVTADGRGINQLNASNVSIGTIAIARGGTGQTTASAAASALGLGVEDQPSFVTVTANVIAHNVASTSLTTGILPYVHSTKQLRDSKLSYNDATYVTSLASNLVITGNLYVQGSTTFQHSNIHSVSDPIIEIGNANVIDTIDMGIIMTRPTANVAAGFRGNEKEYTIAFTLSDPDGAHIVPTMATSDGYITANVWGNVLSGNVTSTGLIHGGTLKGDGSAITVLNMGNAGSGSLAIARGGTGQTTASAAASALGVGAEDQPSFVTVNANVNAGNVVTTTIELGHASDTTLARSSAGVVTIEGVEIRTGTVPIGKGGTGAGSASAAASALGVGTEDSPQFTAIQLGHASDTTIARSSAGVVTIEGVEIRTGTVPIAKGGTGAGSASAAASALGVGTEDSPQFTAIQLGHTSDTTLARSSAGVVTIEGAVVRTGTVAVGDGGTGLDTVTAGDILYASADNTIAARAKGDNGQFLKLSGGVPVWDSVSVSSTTISTTDVTVENTDHGLIFVSDSGTGAQALKKEYGTLKYKPSSGTLTTSNIVTSDTSIHARNGIANTTPTHTLSVGTVVSIRESASGDVIIVRGDGYFGENVYIAKKLTIPAGGEIVADKITVRSLQTKGSVVIADRPPTSGIVLS